MIEYEWNIHKQRWEFLFLTPDNKQYDLGYLRPNMTEEEKMKLLVKWFNACLKQYEKTSSEK